MEREALGPVRREPTVGTLRFEAPEQAEPTHFEERPFEEQLPDLEELGYHDSTAPHPHRVHEAPHLDIAGDHAAAQPADPADDEQPRRRFLRRSRPASLAEPAPPIDQPHVAHDLPTEFHDLPERPAAGHEQFAETLNHDELPAERSAQREPSSDREQLRPHHEQPVPDHEQPAPRHEQPPPHLEFNHPPKRPRFTAEPPVEALPADEQPPTAEERLQPREEPTSRMPPSEVEPAPAPPDATRRPDADDEDVLEETPEFLQDTPEHDRLWFEQRPPRDFDFDG
jgi:hypothetical protein